MPVETCRQERRTTVFLASSDTGPCRTKINQYPIIIVKMMLPIRIVVACVAAVVVAKKLTTRSEKNRNVTPVPETDKEDEETELAPQISTSNNVSDVCLSETMSRSTATANGGGAIEETFEVEEVTSKAELVPAIKIDAVTAGSDSFEVAPRKSSFSKLMKKVSGALPSPRKQTA